MLFRFSSRVSRSSTPTCWLLSSRFRSLFAAAEPLNEEIDSSFIIRITNSLAIESLSHELSHTASDHLLPFVLSSLHRSATSLPFCMPCHCQSRSALHLSQNVIHIDATVVQENRIVRKLDFLEDPSNSPIDSLN